MKLLSKVSFIEHSCIYLHIINLHYFTIMKDFIEKHGFKKRFGTEDEISDIAMLLALGLYKDAVNYKDHPVLHDVDLDLGMNKFLEKNRKDYIKQINDTLLVLDYSKYNIKLYTCFLQYQEQNEKNSIFFYPMTFYKSNTEFLQISNDFSYINFERENDFLKKSKVGRPKRPSEESLVKTLNIHLDMEQSRDINDTIEGFCKNRKLAKSTYYRVNRWLAINPLIKLIK